MNISIVKKNKSIPKGLNFELPRFSVLTGVNGSGKTHLFEVMSDLSSSEILLNEKKLTNIVYIKFGDLVPTIKEKCTNTEIYNKSKSAWKEFERSIMMSNQNLMSNVNGFEQMFLANLNHDMRNVAKKIIKNSGVDARDLNESVVIEFFDYNSGADVNVFNAEFAQIYKAYHLSEFDNKVKRVYDLDETDKEKHKHLSEDEFVKRFGNPPWDFVNEVLNKLSLPYETNSPTGSNRESDFNFKLIHKDTKAEISSDDLSTGEKTLMSLALAIYNSSFNDNRTELIILDEPDAALHPTMSKLMIDIIKEDIVDKSDISVLLSTHSPTTVACTPISALYKISAIDKSVTKCDLKDSIDILTCGIPNLKVSIENQRQVFVEYSYDAQYYRAIFDILSNFIEFPTYPHFLPPHNREGSNCSDVQSITKKMSEMNNENIYGLIDWDKKNKADNQLIILGMERRYSIENYLFEPHIIGLYLIYMGFVKPSELGINNCNSYNEVVLEINKENEALQIIVNSVQNKIQWSEKSEELLDSKLINGNSIAIRKEFFEMQGHELETLIKSTWQKLFGVKNNNDNKDSYLKLDIINKIVSNFPELLSNDIVETFKEIK